MLEIADHLGLSAPGDRTAAKIEKLLAWLETLKAELGIPKSIRESWRSGSRLPGERG